MAAAPPTSRELDTYRERIDRFVAELDEEYYLHYAGHKDTLDLKALYESYPDLSALDQAQALGDAASATAASPSSGASPRRTTSPS